MKEVQIKSHGEPLLRAVDQKAKRMSVALCELVGIDRSHVTEIHADMDGDGEVTVTATVVHKIGRADFDKILNES